jgi:TAG lipase/steryl ester hydrolase/phospholipase A2/LPA acyltransferase
MSFLHDSVLPGANRFHKDRNNDSVTTPATRRLRKSQSHGGLLSPLVQLVRNPVTSIGDILGSLREGGVSGEEDGETRDRKQILYLRMKEVCCNIN